MTAYYNEYDAGAAAWLRELIRRGLIADGVVDERSILDVTADDLRGFTQCHFFAGIGGWSYALRLAGWPDDQPVWTGSPPCQPFSTAGQQKGQDDERHLAPHFATLVAAGRPPILFGEQVASAAVFGKPAKRAEHGASGQPEWAWIDDLFGRLEAAHYACGAADIPAAGVGAPHIRQRTFFGAVRLVDTDGTGPQRRVGVPERADERAAGPGSLGGGLADAMHAGRAEWRPGAGNRPVTGSSASGGMADAGCDSTGSESGNSAETSGFPQTERGTEQCADVFDGRSQGDSGQRFHGGDGLPSDAARTSAVHGGWADADWLFCRDGKWRPVEPGTFPLAHGLPARVVRLRGYGNAIVPQAAAAFIKTFCGVIK